MFVLMFFLNEFCNVLHSCALAIEVLLFIPSLENHPLLGWHPTSLGSLPVGRTSKEGAIPTVGSPFLVFSNTATPRLILIGGVLQLFEVGT